MVDLAATASDTVIPTAANVRLPVRNPRRDMCMRFLLTPASDCDGSPFRDRPIEGVRRRSAHEPVTVRAADGLALGEARQTEGREVRMAARPVGDERGHHV